MVDVTVQGLTVPNSPLVAKAYDAAMIRVTDIQDGHVGVLSTFRVDASRYFLFEHRQIRNIWILLMNWSLIFK